MLCRSVTLLLVFSATFAIGQQISGIVIDAKTNEPIPGASVYFDGSTLGTVSDLDGRFRINAPLKTQASLIVSHLGYALKKLTTPSYDIELKIGMIEDVQHIPEVILTSDPFTRKQKLRVFRKEFLGDTKAAKDCKILNEESIELFFNSYENTLSANAKGTIIIDNKYLGYLINFDLDEFKIHFRRKSLDRIDNIKYTVIAGFTHFTDNTPTDLKIAEKRRDVYLGSPMHFMRTCWSNNWEDQNFSFTKDLRAVGPDEILNVINKEADDFKEIEFQYNQFVIYFKNKSYYRSTIDLAEENPIFSIDKYGKYEPFRNLTFGGYMADLRIAEMLPIDFHFEWYSP